MNKLLNYLSLLFFLICYGCQPQKGTVVITTYPIPGEISIDGNVYKKTPVTIELARGNHEVVFSDYSNQYETPPPQSIIIERGAVQELTGTYRNRFLPAHLPEGFAIADTLRIYGTEQRRLKDGTIFDYIDGGGIVYLNHGLRETTHATYKSQDGTTIVIDIFDMATPENAKDAFSDDAICPEGFSSMSIGREGKTYSFEPDYLIYFYTSHYLVFLSITDDHKKNILIEMATQIAHNIP